MSNLIRIVEPVTLESFGVSGSHVASVVSYHPCSLLDMLGLEGDLPVIQVVALIYRHGNKYNNPNSGTQKNRLLVDVRVIQPNKKCKGAAHQRTNGLRYD